MASTKRLQQATVKFRKENPMQHFAICRLISGMANYIRKTGVAEVTVGINKYGEYYEQANQ